MEIVTASERLGRRAHRVGVKRMPALTAVAAQKHIGDRSIMDDVSIEFAPGITIGV